MVIAFDIGGTNTRIAYSKEGETLSEPVIYPTPENFEDGIRQFVTTVKKLTNGQQITAIAGGIPGPMDVEKTMLLKAPNLKGWNNKPLKTIVEKELGAPVYLENDTAMWGIGEATQGAGKGFEIMVYITVSTGVGGTRIVDGNIDKSAQGFEPGHQIISPDGPECGCGGKGHLEAYISGSAMQKRTGMSPKDVHDPHIWDKEAKYLAIGLLNTAVFWSPHCIVLGGSMMKNISIDAVCNYMGSYNHILPTLPLIKKSSLNDMGGLIGSLSVAWYNSLHGSVDRRTGLQTSTNNL
ncbi:MAG TPA: ROK family protein [Candidatus Andersenbacteria bacterium]|nr:ROK family protein [Candidatus Andersenbacteria bacterium]